MGGARWVAIRYDWGDDGLTLAETTSPAVLAIVKEALLKEAKQRLSISRETDEIIALLSEAELKRLQAVLDRLIPEESA